MSVASGPSTPERVGLAYVLPIFTAADFLHSAITLLESDAVRNPQRDPSVYLCLRCLRRVTRYESETGVGWPDLLLPEDYTTLPDPAVDLFDDEPPAPASSPVGRPSSCPPLRVVDPEGRDYTTIALGPDTLADSDPSSDPFVHTSDTSVHTSDTSVHTRDTSAHSRTSPGPGALASSPTIAVTPSTPPTVPQDSPPSYTSARGTNYTNALLTTPADPPPYVHPRLPAPPSASVTVRANAPFAPGWDPLVPWFSPPSHANVWYVVTMGRRVGVFDSRMDVTTAIVGLSGDVPVSEHHSREAAMRDFSLALASGTVHAVRPRE